MRLSVLHLSTAYTSAKDCEWDAKPFAHLSARSLVQTMCWQRFKRQNVQAQTSLALVPADDEAEQKSICSCCSCHASVHLVPRANLKCCSASSCDMTWCSVTCCAVTCCHMACCNIRYIWGKHLSSFIHLRQDLSQLDCKAHFKEAVSLIKDTELYSPQAHALHLLQMMHQAPWTQHNRESSKHDTSLLTAVQLPCSTVDQQDCSGMPG